MGKIQEKGEIAIGVKYDVPPFGFKNPQRATSRASTSTSARRSPQARRQAEVHRGDLRQPDPVPRERHGRPDPLDDDDQQGARQGDRLLRALLRRPRSRARARGLEDHRRRRPRGKSVCTALGSTYEENLKKQAPEAKLELVDSYSECLELIQNGAVDAVSTDDVILTGMIIQDDTLELVGET